MIEMNLPKHSLLLECIDGKDSRRKIEILNRNVRMGHISMHPDLPVDEILNNEGYIEFYPQDKKVGFDAGKCLTPVYLNNIETKTGSISAQDKLRIGSSVWRVQDGTNQISGAIKEKFTDLIGLEELQNFKLSSIFSEVMKKHTREEMEDQLITGTASHTPSITAIETGWAKPWLFARLLLVSIILALVLYSGYSMFENINLVPGLIFVGSFAVPVSTLLFFLEMNAPRNVSIFTVMQLLFTGGIASIILALIFFSKLNFFSTVLGASAAGIIEEAAKILIVIMLMGKANRYPWILNGLLFGAAIGTGFAAFESAGYALRVILDSGLNEGAFNILLRGMLSPFGHIVWTANAAAAFWMVKGDKPFSWEMLQAPAFLRILISVMVMHMLWDAPFTILHLPVFIDIKFILIGVISWIICFRLVQAGLKQINTARQKLMQG